jgi:uncharacterized membrane protein YeiH
MNTIYTILMMLGTLVLAISGSLTSMEKRFDIFGVVIIAFVTAVGGGTLRDMLINRDVFWLVDSSYIYIIIGGSIFAIIFRKALDHLRKILLLFDTLGLALFTILGAEIGLNYDLSFISCVILATITGVVGGILRDVLVNEIPVIFQKEIYATISILGAILFLLLQYISFNDTATHLIPIFLIIILRLLVVRFQISLPSIYKREKVQ